MMNKVYEIKRADMLNIKEYTVWKHADEEVWEVDDGKTFAGSDSLAMVERKQVIEFDYEGQHYRIYRKEGDVFGKNECLDYMTFRKRFALLIIVSLKTISFISHSKMPKLM